MDSYYNSLKLSQKPRGTWLPVLELDITEVLKHEEWVEKHFNETYRGSHSERSYSFYRNGWGYAD
jgi:hypothetical protein